MIKLLYAAAARSAVVKYVHLGRDSTSNGILWTLNQLRCADVPACVCKYANKGGGAGPTGRPDARGDKKSPQNRNSGSSVDIDTGWHAAGGDVEFDKRTRRDSYRIRHPYVMHSAEFWHPTDRPTESQLFTRRGRLTHASSSSKTVRRFFLKPRDSVILSLLTRSCQTPRRRSGPVRSDLGIVRQ